jgi:hypothetical protein
MLNVAFRSAKGRSSEKRLDSQRASFRGAKGDILRIPTIFSENPWDPNQFGAECREENAWNPKPWRANGFASKPLCPKFFDDNRSVANPWGANRSSFGISPGQGAISLDNRAGFHENVGGLPRSSPFFPIRKGLAQAGTAIRPRFVRLSDVSQFFKKP